MHEQSGFVPRSDLLQVLFERGFKHDITLPEKLDELARNTQLCAYIGFDATAPSLHAGSLTPIMMLYWLQQTGHKPLVVMGGGTSLVGDPSGKEETRKLLDPQRIADNIGALKGNFTPFLSFAGNNAAHILNNADWLMDLSYIDFLRDIGIHFTLNRMLTFDSVKSRLQSDRPMSYLEFNYMLMQGYDFLHLNRVYGCRLQMGGSDQWGNILNGVELCRRCDRPVVYGLTAPLLVTADGRKMGKTENGAVWLNADLCSPYHYWQYWRNTHDADTGVFLRRFTTLPLAEIARLEKLAGSEINEAKKILAFEATRLLHGEKAAQAAQKTAEAVFEKGAAGDDLPAHHIAQTRLREGYPLADAFLDCGLCPSKSALRRHLAAGAVRINGKVQHTETPLVETDLQEGRIRISIGKKKHGVVTVA